jgi:hypothetical protein
MALHINMVKFRFREKPNIEYRKAGFRGQGIRFYAKA